jgi:hypothetical protein
MRGIVTGSPFKSIEHRWLQERNRRHASQARGTASNFRRILRFGEVHARAATIVLDLYDI